MQTHYFQQSEGTLAYTDYGGDGELVLMLPGMGALRSEYRFLAPRLVEAGYHAVSADLRGQGESSVPWPVYDVPTVGEDILALIEHLEAGPAHVITTSFSAGSAVWAAAEKPDSVRSITLIGAFVRNVALNPVMGGLFWLMTHNPWRVSFWAMYYGTIYPSQKPDDFQDYITELKRNMSEPGRFDAALAMSASSRRPSEERLDRLDVPVLVVMGTKDPDFPDPVAEARYIAEKTGARLELIEGAGHYPQTEMPEKTNPIILEFLEKSENGNAG